MIDYCIKMLTFVGMNQEETDFYKGLAIYFLPEGVTEYFDLVDYCEEAARKVGQLNTKELHLYLDEKDNRPEGGAGIKANGFMEEKQILDFPVCGRSTVLCVRRWRWLTTEGKNAIVPLADAAKIVYEGTSYSKELALFKEIG